MERNHGTIFNNTVAIVLTITSFVISWMFILPQYKDSRTKQLALNTEVTAARDKLESLKTAQKSLDGLGTVLDQIFVAIPNDKDAPNLISELEAIASKNKTYIPSVQISDGATTDSTSSVMVAFSVTGDFQSLQGFIKSLESDLKFFNIQSMSLSSGDKDMMTLSVQVEVYKTVDTSLATVGSVSSTSSTSGAQ